jgi:hypothetical protein
VLTEMTEGRASVRATMTFDEWIGLSATQETIANSEAGEGMEPLPVEDSPPVVRTAGTDVFLSLSRAQLGRQSSALAEPELPTPWALVCQLLTPRGRSSSRNALPAKGTCV